MTRQDERDVNNLSIRVEKKPFFGTAYRQATRLARKLGCCRRASDNDLTAR
jgi:hypothetical protein